MENWIATKDRTPSPIGGEKGFMESDYMLCTQKDFTTPFVGWYSCKQKTWHVAHYKADLDPVEVTHWMPLPKPPKP